MIEHMEKIPVRPWICTVCGNIELLSDRQASQTAGNCANPKCSADEVVPAGPRQKVLIGLDRRGINLHESRVGPGHKSRVKSHE